MHHTLRFYTHFREGFLRYYIWQAKWTRVPLIGRAVRWVGNKYGETSHGAYLLTPEEARQLIDLSPELLVGPCACRHVFHNCENPLNAELMLGKANPFVESRPADYRPVSREEARALLDSCRARGLVSTIIKCRRDFYAICNCCSCCCVPLRLRKDYGIGSALVRSPDIVAEFNAWLAEAAA